MPKGVKKLTEEWKKNISKALSNNPTHHFRGMTGEKNYANRSDVKKKIGDANRGRKHSEKQNRNHGEMMKQKYKDGFKNWNADKKISKEDYPNFGMRGKKHKPHVIKILKKYSFKKGNIPHNKDKKLSKKHLLSLFNAWSRRPSGYELKVKEILDKYLPNKWKYVGDFEFIIGLKNPDFINMDGLKICIEVFGEYFKKFNYGSKERYIAIRRKHYEKFGWQVIFLDDDEYYNPKIVLEKIKVIENE